MQSPSKQFITEITADSSPTLRLISSATEKPESMHHSGGAATETNYIYGEAILKALNHQKNLQFLVVGLGLGYIEILISSLADVVKIESYEVDDELRLNFAEWIKGSDQFEIYNEVCKSLKLDTLKIRKKLQAVNEININSELSIHSTFKEKSNVICFDAFSQKTSGSLWTEDFLNYFIISACADDCLFTTYACTSLLKRVLIKNGFTLIKREGYAGKRESTLAVRGVFDC